MKPIELILRNGIYSYISFADILAFLTLELSRLQNCVARPTTSFFQYKYVLSPQHLFTLDIPLSYTKCPKHLLYPGQLATFRFQTETEPKPDRIRSKQIRPK